MESSEICPIHSTLFFLPLTAAKIQFTYLFPFEWTSGVFGVFCHQTVLSQTSLDLPHGGHAHFFSSKYLGMEMLSIRDSNLQLKFST